MNMFRNRQFQPIYNIYIHDKQFVIIIMNKTTTATTTKRNRNSIENYNYTDTRHIHTTPTHRFIQHNFVLMSPYCVWKIHIESHARKSYTDT